MKRLILLFFCFVTLNVNGKVLMADLNDGLVAYYPFNGNTKDESGNENNGIAEGITLSKDRFNNSNSAYKFDGQNDYINVPNINLLNFGKGSFTISVWVKVDDNMNKISNYFIIDKRKGSGAGKGYGFYLNSYVAKCALQGCTPNLTISSGIELNDSEWHHIVVVIDKTNSISLIYDNLNIVKGGAIDCDITNEGDLYIGCRFTKQEYFPGAIDDVRIYNRAL